MKTLEEFRKDCPPIKVERFYSVDTVRLYGNLKDAADYLIELHELYPDGALYENWYSYEDFELVVRISEYETGDEWLVRTYDEYKKYVYENEKSRKDKRRKELEDQIKKLQRNLDAL